MLYAVKEPKNKKARRALMAREPKLVENEKRTMVVTGHSCTQTTKQVLDELAALKQPNVVKLSKKNKILPFEDAAQLEFLAHKNDASLFLMGTSNKKRPNNVLMGRMFDFHVLDMIEFGVENFHPASEFGAAAPGLGMRPCFIFCGDEFEQNPEMKRFGNLMLDFFGGRPTSMINLRGLESVIVLTAAQGVVHFHHYAVTLHKSSDRLPRVELEEVGPAFEARLGRSKLAAEAMWKQAVVVNKAKTRDPSKPHKNIEIDTLGSRLGTVHVGKQDLSTLVLKKNKALRKSNKAFRDGEEGEEDGSLKKTTKKARVETEVTDI